MRSRRSCAPTGRGRAAPPSRACCAVKARFCPVAPAKRTMPRHPSWAKRRPSAPAAATGMASPRKTHSLCRRNDGDARCVKRPNLYQVAERMTHERVGFVMPGLVPGIHAAERSDRLRYCPYGRICFSIVKDGGTAWIAGTSPAMTESRRRGPHPRDLVLARLRAKARPPRLPPSETVAGRSAVAPLSPEAAMRHGIASGSFSAETTAPRQTSAASMSPASDAGASFGA